MYLKSPSGALTHTAPFLGLLSSNVSSGGSSRSTKGLSPRIKQQLESRSASLFSSIVLSPSFFSKRKKSIQRIFSILARMFSIFPFPLSLSHSSYLVTTRPYQIPRNGKLVPSSEQTNAGTKVRVQVAARDEGLQIAGRRGRKLRAAY